MQKQFGKLVLMAALSLSALSLTAMAQQVTRRTAHIDFAFTVGAQQMPAGDYVFEPLHMDNPSQLLLVRNTATGAQAIVATFRARSESKSQDAPLNFNKYGDQHYLAQVTLGGNAYQLVKSGAERKLAQNFAPLTSKGKGTVSEVR